MTEQIKVVKPYYILEQAYQMGHQTGHDARDTVDADIGPEDLSHFKETAQWANNVAPELRAMSGFSDHGHGTYTDGGKVAAIDPGCEEDEPADAELIDAQHLFDKVVEAYDTGYLDGAEGTYDPDSVTHWY